MQVSSCCKIVCSYISPHYVDFQSKMIAEMRGKRAPHRQIAYQTNQPRRVFDTHADDFSLAAKLCTFVNLS